jgi:transcriptional regulator of acetoin/glycerol metabolism
MVQREEITHIEEIQRVLEFQHPSSRDSAVVDSWRRCIQKHSLDPAIRRGAYILPHKDLKEHQERSEDLLRTARFGLETLYQEVADKNYVVLLTDEAGVTIDYIGNPDKDEALRQAGLYLGAEWSEERAGTCGVGSCLYTGKAITVHQTDHFDAANIALTCTAAPIYDPLGNLTAVLDVSALHSPESKDSQSFAQHLVRIWAARIELAALLNHFPAEWIVTFSKSPVFLEVAPQCAVALNADGTIAGMTSNARELLCVEPHLKPKPAPIGRRLEAFFDFSVNDLPSLTRVTPVHQRLVRVCNGETLFVSAHPTHRPKTVRAQRAVGTPEETLHGGDPKMAAIAQKLPKLVAAQVNILLQGETGTGKEFLARHIHEQRRIPGPFVAINCAAIPESLIESELFGYENGSFTGARSKGKLGLIEQANGGTLFLDEIGDMPLELQARLLRVLAEKEVMRVGSTKPKPVDLRVISASHRELRECVELGEFRGDLYYRIAGITFHLPALRERQDLAWIIERLLETKNRQYQKQLVLSRPARQALLNYDWPGNIRQLVNVIELIEALSEGVVTLDDLPEELQTRRHDSAHVSLPSEACAADTPALEQLLEQHHWNITAVARQLGCNRKTVYRRMKREKIPLER